jgi:hypothetical protein
MHEVTSGSDDGVIRRFYGISDKFTRVIEHMIMQNQTSLCLINGRDDRLFHKLCGPGRQVDLHPADRIPLMSVRCAGFLDKDCVSVHFKRQVDGEILPDLMAWRPQPFRRFLYHKITIAATAITIGAFA